jgi:hypothetical protein
VTVRTGVIVPVHGWPALLAETLDGLLAQDPRPEVVVVVDDGSPEPVALHPDHAPHCRLVRHSRRRGPSPARATGLAQLDDVELVAFCDADDVWEPGKHAAQLAAFGAHPDASACFGRARIVGLDGRPTGERWDELAPGCHSAGLLLPLLYERNPLCSSSALLRRQAVIDAGGLEYPLARAEDWDLWLRLLARGHAFVMEPEAVVRYRRSPGSLSGDIAELARAQVHLHQTHGGLVDEPARRRAEAADHVAHARGLVRRRDYGPARDELRRAFGLRPPDPKERALATILAIPGLRAALGRRDPYAGRR